MADVALSPVTSCELVYVFSFFEKHHDQFRNNDHDHKKNLFHIAFSPYSLQSAAGTLSDENIG